MKKLSNFLLTLFVSISFFAQSVVITDDNTYSGNYSTYSEIKGKYLDKCCFSSNIAIKKLNFVFKKAKECLSATLKRTKVYKSNKLME